jgi:hypothetical protein
MDEKIIYVVTAHRNSLSQHSYVVGLYENVDAADQAASIETANRGGKYNMWITRYVLNKLPEDLIDIERD